MAVVTSSRAGRLGNRIAIAAVIVITLIFPVADLLDRLDGVQAAQSWPPPCRPPWCSSPQITPFVKLFTKRAQLTAPVEPAVYEAAPWWEKLVLDGGERLGPRRQGRGAVCRPIPDRFINSLIVAITSTFLAVSMGTITAYGFSRFKVKGEADCCSSSSPRACCRRSSSPSRCS